MNWQLTTGNCSRRVLAIIVLAVTLSDVSDAVRQEWRALWVDTFNSSLNSHADVLRIVSAARAARLNVILAQVRRRGDAWYLDSREPPPDFTAIESGFDPLADLVQTAHAFGIEVHAFVIVGAIWNKDPALAPPANGPPLDPRHAFNRHGGYSSATRTITSSPDNWLTRTLLPDSANTSYQGHRIGPEFWLDFGHPDAAAYTVEVLLHLVQRYDLDGLHLDRIRYPELTAAGQTPSTGANIGYNPVSVARFHRKYGRDEASAAPAPGDPQWAEWRRTQITNLVRRIYLNVAAIKPRVTVSAALIAFGGGPATDAGWSSAEAYWRVYQDWRAWLEEGILDLAIPMNYKREHDPAQARQYDEWIEWLKPRQYRRATIVGLGAFLNGAEGTLRQARRALAPNAAGTSAAGVALFSLANATDAVAANPWSIPPGVNSPKREFDELAAALTTGDSRDRETRFESISPPVFQDEALVPLLPWKQAPRTGHLMGFAFLDAATPADSVPVYVADLRTGLVRTLETDGGGFFGAVDLPPGPYVVSIVRTNAVFYAPVNIRAGRVTSVSFRPGRE